MISSQDVLSNPIGSFARLLYSYSSIIQPDQIKLPHGTKKKDLEFLLEHSEKLFTDSRFKGVMRKYKMYMDDFFDSLELFSGSEVIFLGVNNLCLEDSNGRFQQLCVDDFSPESDFVKYLVKHYMEHDSSVKNALDTMLFMRIGAYDFPFVISNDEQNLNLSSSFPVIKNPFGFISERVNQVLEGLDLQGRLGSSERNINDIFSEANYRFSSKIISVADFRKSSKHFGEMELLLKNMKKYLPEKYHSSEEFIKLCESAIMLNRQLFTQKYAYIIDTLSPSWMSAYMFQKDIGLGILSKTGYDIPVIGGKLLTNTKHGPVRAVLEPQALNRLSGWLTARFSQGAEPVIVKSKKKSVESSMDLFNINVDVVSSIKHPYIKTLGSPKSIDEGIKTIDPNFLRLLERDIRNYGFSISSVEVILARLNNENPMISSDMGRIQWRNAIRGLTINPYSITDISKVLSSEAYLTRPSNTGSKCELHKYISILPLDFWKQLSLDSNDASKSGQALHEISNSLLSEQYKMLEKYGMKSLRRREYCEVPIVHEFKPSVDDIINAETHLKRKIKSSKNPSGKKFYELMLQEISRIHDENISIYDSGKPDAVAIIEETSQPVIIDFKRRMGMYYATPYFFEQASRYALAVMQAKNLEVDSFFTVIVQTPFSANKFIGEDISDLGVYRHQKLTIRQVSTDSNFLKKVKKDLVIEYAGNRLFMVNSNARELVRDMYSDSPDNVHPLCPDCFANKQESPQCRYLLEGIGNIW
jgi:hypothetical protein